MRALEPGAHLATADRAGLLQLSFAVLVHDEGWNASDTLSRRELRELFGVDLRHDRSIRELTRYGVDFRCRRTTSAAPRGPKLDEHRHARFPDQELEQLRLDVDRAIDRWKHLAARPALAAIGQTVGRDPIELPAGGTSLRDGVHAWIVAMRGPPLTRRPSRIDTRLAVSVRRRRSRDRASADAGAPLR